MKRGILVITTLLLLAGLLNKPAQASKLQVEINSDPPLCLPAAYPVEPVDCLPFGPSAYLTEMLRKGISYPFRSLPVQHPDPALQYATDSFLSVTSGSISMYTSLEDAISGNPVQTLGPGLMKYLAISQRVERSELSLIHISEPTRLLSISYAVFCLKKKKKNKRKTGDKYSITKL